MAEKPVVDEIASLLDQCSQDELAIILQAIEGGDPVPLVEQGELITADENLSQFQRPPAAEQPIALAQPDVAMEPSMPSSPKVLPPAGPPPTGNGRRPVPAGVRRPSEQEEQQITLSEARRLLEDHSSAVVSEVRKMVPYIGFSSSGLDPAGLDLETLTKVLAARDDEVRELETQLSSIQDELSAKDRRVTDLGGELDSAVREVRHRQLDLEFQQLKLEETVRNNAEMEQMQRSLVARVDEAGLSTRHAALDVDLGRSMPGMMRAQGSLPWAVRKKRPF